MATAPMKGYLSVCAIYRNEARYLRSGSSSTGWSASSTSSSTTTTAPTTTARCSHRTCAAGVVTLTDWPEFPAQLPAYDHCLEANRHDSRWIAFIDLDEFLFSPAWTPVPRGAAPTTSSFPAVGALG